MIDTIDMKGYAILSHLYFNHYHLKINQFLPPEEYMRKIINFDKMGLPSEHPCEVSEHV